MPAWVVDLLNRLNSTFVVDGRWQWFVSGLGYTLLISLFSVLLGLVIGILMALMRLSKSKILRAVSGIYIDIIRGTPTMVQLLIIYFVQHRQHFKTVTFKISRALLFISSTFTYDYFIKCMHRTYIVYSSFNTSIGVIRPPCQIT